MARFDPFIEYLTPIDSSISIQSGPYLVYIDKLNERASRRPNRSLLGEGLGDMYILWNQAVKKRKLNQEDI